MLSTESTERASNWDFSPVFDLLRSPTYEGSSYLASTCNSELPSSSEEKSRHVKLAACSPAFKPKPQRSYTRLGDFGTLWDLLGQELSSTQSTKDTLPAEAPNTKPHDTKLPLGQSSGFTILKRPSQDETGEEKRQPIPSTSRTSAIFASGDSKPQISQTTLKECSNPSSSAKVITLLKRTADTSLLHGDPAITLHPRSPPRPIGGVSSSPIYTPKAKTKAIANEAKSTLKDELLLSESSAGAESDSSAVIFDQPVSKKSGVLTFVPAQVGTLDARTNHCETPSSSFDEKDSTLTSDAFKNVISTSAGIRVLPATYSTATDRRIGLMTRLLKDFPEYAQLVSQVGHSSKSNKKCVESRPIHVFVDMSNIMVGFHDSVKVSRNIPVTTRIRRLHMSFSNFSLIMERGRPAAKRVLVGSDRLPSIDEAEKLGYEANILDRVHKVKHTTPRPPKFKKASGFASQAALGPEMAGASGERWVEQGVDEILHLKILESLLDTDEPATIVLATGDAAEAEYSGGFMLMVERALQRGWALELVSFSQVTSYAYRKKEFRAKWGHRFRMIELDSYVEELFD
ncbi:hypothetical protein N7462_007947 [Penicillium macrosclerotiorum]|uniref:uncharacterized protein n=1 Tax=Penicillium macrosclerotiorum TaxID=303699 RepID=UPI002547E699|nr:uncharacterized protein N7462_007947 [Penicillium macrosclerotiorum]KAJ5679703.1 hypothetical protein N7462_007947 [Penicillium macrosclerotiorum]